MNSKLLKKKQLKLYSIKFKKQKKKIILVHGVFDVIHLGHISHFKEAKSYGDILVVSITPDKFVKKGFNKPYFDELQRAQFLSSLEIIDYVVVNDGKSSTSIINELKPSIYCKGPDYSKKSGDIADNLGAEKNAVEKCGGKLVFTKENFTHQQKYSITILKISISVKKKLMKFTKIKQIELLH